MSIQLKGFNEAQALAQTLPEEIQQRAAKLALKRAGEIVVRAAKTNVPSSRMSGTFYRQSKKQQEKSPRPLFDTITQRTRSYSNGISVEVVGPSWPDGNHGHLVEHGHEAVYWGRKGNPARVEGKEFLAPAADSTKNQQQQIIIASLQKSIKNHEARKLKGG